MTESPDRPARVFESVGQAVDALRAEGLRLSTPRRLVLEALFAADGPVSAAHLADSLSLDESSVYRNLELLEQRGIVRHLHLGHSPGLYVRSAHHELEYLYCETCAKVTAVEPERLDAARAEIRTALGHEPRFTHFAIVGTCAQCAGRRRATGHAGDELHSHGGYVHAHAAPAAHRH